jgi:hypothetical protein
MRKSASSPSMACSCAATRLSPGVVTVSSDVDFNLATGVIPMGKGHRRTHEKL